MNNFDATIKNICTDSDVDRAWHNLIELGKEAVPAMIRAFRNDSNSEKKAWLLSAIAENREPLYDFYKECLLDPKKPVWNQSITALCTLGSTESEKVLLAVRGQLEAARIESTKREYIDEAIEIIREQRSQGPA